MSNAIIANTVLTPDIKTYIDSAISAALTKNSKIDRYVNLGKSIVNSPLGQLAQNTAIAQASKTNPNLVANLQVASQLASRGHRSPRRRSLSPRHRLSPHRLSPKRRY